MAKVFLNPLFDGIHGKVGNVIFRRTADGSTIMYERPDKSSKAASAAQKAHRQRFKEAVQYAKAAMADPERKAHYERTAQELNKRPFDVAISEYFKGMI